MDITIELFRKRLSETDILTRLIIPVRVALMDYLPALQDEEKMLLEVRDREGRAWVFVYSKSGYSSMFTGGGWRDFAVKKGLKPGDVLMFFLCREREWPWRSRFLVVPVKRNEMGEMEVKEEKVESRAEPALGQRKDEMMEEKKKKMKVFGVWLEF